MRIKTPFKALNTRVGVLVDDSIGVNIVQLLLKKRLMDKIKDKLKLDNLVWKKKHTRKTHLLIELFL